MKVENKVMPNEKQMEEFLEEGNDEPIFMVNLLKFKEKAEYPDKRETELSGREAYAIYGVEVVKHLEKWAANPFSAQMLLGLCWVKWKSFGIKWLLLCTQIEKQC